MEEQRKRRKSTGDLPQGIVDGVVTLDMEPECKAMAIGGTNSSRWQRQPMETKAGSADSIGSCSFVSAESTGHCPSPQRQQQQRAVRANWQRPNWLAMPPPSLSPFCRPFDPAQNVSFAPVCRRPPSPKCHRRGKLHYSYLLSRAQLKASSRISALLSGFAMIALVELIYQRKTPHLLLTSLAVVTALLVSVHLLTLLMSTCLLPYIEAHGCTNNSPHIKFRFLVELSWLFSTCIGLVLFLLEIVIIFFVKFDAVGYNWAAWITTGILVPVLLLFGLFSYLIRRKVMAHSAVGPVGKNRRDINGSVA